MIHDIRSFAPISLRPHWKQLIINQSVGIVLCAILYTAYALYCHIMFLNNILLYTGLAMTCYLIYQVLYIIRMEYIVTGDQIIFIHGIVNHSTDYMELYRVIDYQQHRTLLQQLCGLKTVIIFSGDRNTPIMNIIGIKENIDVVREIRRRVEYNKKMKHIYEITNKP